MTEWITAKVTEIKQWTDSLFSLQLAADIAPFSAGQFAKLALDIDGIRVQRAYSYVNAPSDQALEFYLVTIDGGKLSPKLQALQVGDELMLSRQASGFFVLNEIPSCDTLWMLATGTAIGPYLSILQEGHDLERFKHIVLVHAVRYGNELSYQPLMASLAQRYQDKLHIQTVVSRETLFGSLHGRIPALIKEGKLEDKIALSLEVATSHVMLCGNPEMVRETQQMLKEVRGMSKHLRQKPGQITAEHYW